MYIDIAAPIVLAPDADIFHGVDVKNCTLVVPMGTKMAYCVAEEWKKFGEIVEREEE